jgi:GT2 family glycosyltransferase
MPIVNQSSHARWPYGVVAICTKDRPDELEMSCSAVHATSPQAPILVIDASTTEATRNLCESLTRRYESSLHLTYRRAHRPGLTRQRNEAVGICRELGVEIIHFIDDDTEVSAGYFDAIEHRFRQDPTVIGLGGVIVNQPRVDYVTVKSFFLLWSRRQGSVLKSGRNVMGQYPGAQANDHVDWLSGCSMSYRMTAFDDLMFDGRLAGYSLGEDYDFGFRLSRMHRLAVEPSATCVHHMTPVMRGSARVHACERTKETHRWVNEHRELGMSRTAFWWSAFGDFLLRMGYGVFRRDTKSVQEAFGVVEGVVAIARNL